MTRGILEEGEPHPAAFMAMEWLKKFEPEELMQLQESFSSCAIEGNHLAEICSETLERVMTGQMVSDRYLLGLCWAIVTMENAK